MWPNHCLLRTKRPGADLKITSFLSARGGMWVFQDRLYGSWLSDTELVGGLALGF